MLKENGYTTGIFGKWHLGSRQEWGPMDHGFDEFYGFNNGATDYFKPSKLVRGVPADLDRLCVRLLSRRAHRRPAGQDILRLLGACS